MWLHSFTKYVVVVNKSIKSTGTTKVSLCRKQHCFMYVCVWCGEAQKYIYIGGLLIFVNCLKFKNSCEGFIRYFVRFMNMFMII